MRKGMVGLVSVLFCGALLVGGCAKKEMVKGEETVVPPVAAEKAVETPQAKPPVKEEVVKEQPIKEVPASVSEGSVKEVGINVVPASELDTVYFDFDSFILSPPSRETLTKNSKWLLKNGRVKIQIEGHCDERGSDEYNLALGEKRAKSAMNYLVTLGVPANQLSVISFGKEKPADPGHTEAAWAKNRRAAFVIIK